MEAIRHRVGMEAPAREVYEALATREGLTRWWTRDVQGRSEVGDRLSFFFGGPGPAAVMEVTDLDPSSLVRWRCVEGPAEWTGTTVTFELHGNGEETVVLFTHAGWREPNEFMHHCSTRWGYFLLGLRAGFQGGKATPWPEDEPASSSWR